MLVTELEIPVAVDLTVSVAPDTAPVASGSDGSDGSDGNLNPGSFPMEYFGIDTMDATVFNLKSGVFSRPIIALSDGGFGIVGKVGIAGSDGAAGSAIFGSVGGEIFGMPGSDAVDNDGADGIAPLAAATVDVVDGADIVGIGIFILIVHHHAPVHPHRQP